MRSTPTHSFITAFQFSVGKTSFYCLPPGRLQEISPSPLPQDIAASPHFLRSIVRSRQRTGSIKALLENTARVARPAESEMSLCSLPNEPDRLRVQTAATHQHAAAGHLRRGLGQTSKKANSINLLLPYEFVSPCPIVSICQECHNIIPKTGGSNNRNSFSHTSSVQMLTGLFLLRLLSLIHR